MKAALAVARAHSSHFDQIADFWTEKVGASEWQETYCGSYCWNTKQSLKQKQQKQEEEEEVVVGGEGKKK